VEFVYRLGERREQSVRGATLDALHLVATVRNARAFGVAAVGREIRSRFSPSFSFSLSLYLSISLLPSIFLSFSLSLSLSLFPFIRTNNASAVLFHPFSAHVSTAVRSPFDDRRGSRSRIVPEEHVAVHYQEIVKAFRVIVRRSSDTRAPKRSAAPPLLSFPILERSVIVYVGAIIRRIG